MKKNDECVKRGCPGVFICDGEYNDFECGHFHVALESKLHPDNTSSFQFPKLNEIDKIEWDKWVETRPKVYSL